MSVIEKNSFKVPALGAQAQSQRETLPSYSISRVGRQQREKAFVTKEHQRTSELCRAGPGHIYDLPDDLGSGPKSRFGTAPQRAPLFGGHSRMEEVPSGDALGHEVDSQPFKYRRDATMLFGTEMKGNLKSGELIENHAAAFFGRGSPGPCSYGDGSGPDITPVRPRLAPARIFGVKTKNDTLASVRQGSTPTEVAPGCYGDPNRALGKQNLSDRKNIAVHRFGKARRFPKGPSNFDDPLSELDAAKSSFGRQSLCRHRSEPSVGFGSATRHHVEKVQPNITGLDEGPRAHLARLVLKQPELPVERRIMEGKRG